VSAAARQPARPIEIPADLPADLMPVAWLVGTWEGLGVGARPGGGEESAYRFRELTTFAHDGRPFLSYSSVLWVLDADGEPADPDSHESGYWRVQRDGALEVLVASATGVVEIYAGTADGPRIDLATDLVGRTATAAPYTAGRRLYGSVEGDLMYAYDAAFAAPEGRPAAGLASLRSARLRRVAS
jgi:hypothetical protein